MKINDKEINLKITPLAIKKTEEMYDDFDFLKLLRDAENDKEPKASDYIKVIYVGYLGATNEDIKYEDFVELINDVDILEINTVGVKLLTTRKN